LAFFRLQNYTINQHARALWREIFRQPSVTGFEGKETWGEVGGMEDGTFIPSFPLDRKSRIGFRRIEDFDEVKGPILRKPNAEPSLLGLC
jgi:hypothetical protein